ncbi:MAG: PEGA domain-containing protein [Myxococcales bacterium]|nr:PEGA domain-containing protein [Myxococcales bacterium]
MRVLDDLRWLSSRELRERLGRHDTPNEPRLELDQIDSLFSEGHTLTYSFEYAKAVNAFQRVLEGLLRLPDSTRRWVLFVKAYLWLGVAKAALKDEDGSREAFLRVLKTRPGMVLSTQDFAPRFIERFEEVKKALPDIPRGKIAVDSEPPGAAVSADGAPLGKTPWIGELPHGSYLLVVSHPEAGTVVRPVEVGPELCRVSLQLAFESSLDLDGSVPLVRLPAGMEDLPVQWWPWLSARLGIQRLIVLGNKPVQGREQVFGALVDMGRYRREREGWLDPSEPERLEQDIADLLRFLATGRAQGRLKVAKLAEAGSPPTDVTGPAAATAPRVLTGVSAARPWYRKWWTWAMGGAALALAGAGCHLGAVYWDQQAEKHTTVAAIEHDRDIARSLRGVAIAGYAVGGAVLITGFILDPTIFRPTKKPGTSNTQGALAVEIEPFFGGVMVTGRF